MTKLRQFARLLAAVQLLPALESGEETLVGGQAVLEGVMMRSPHAWGICVRKPSGELVTHSEPLDRPSDKRKFWGWPFLRGLATLGQAMALGYKALRYSANAALDDGSEKKVEISGWMIAVNVVISIGFFIAAYKFLPLLAATELGERFPELDGRIAFNLLDGVIRLLIFLGFIWMISRWKDVHRVFEYHGAEHKTVFAFESRDPLTTEAAQRYSTFHPRCGTSFLMTIMLISIVVYTLVPAVTFWGRFAARLALLPVIAAVAYEIIRFTAKRQKSLFALMTAPGLWLQRITTQPPDDSQVECAISALNQAMELEKQRGGELVIA